MQTRPPCTAPIGLYADSSGVQVKTTRPGSASVKSIWISWAIGGGGIAPVDHRLQVVEAGHRQALLRPAQRVVPGDGARALGSPVGVGAGRAERVGHRVSWVVGGAGRWCRGGAARAAVRSARSRRSGSSGATACVATPDEQGVEHRAAARGRTRSGGTRSGRGRTGTAGARRPRPRRGPCSRAAIRSRGAPVPRDDVGEPVGAEGRARARRAGPSARPTSSSDAAIGQGRPGRSASETVAARPVVRRCVRWRHAARFAGVSSKVKPTPGRVDTRRRRPARAARCSWSRSGTALVLVTYVTPMATVPQTVADLGGGLGGARLDPQLDERRPRRRPAGLRRPRRRPGPSPRLRRRARRCWGSGRWPAPSRPSSAVFVGARVLEGLGGAAVLACGLAVLAHAFTEPARPGARHRASGARASVSASPPGRCSRPGSTSAPGGARPTSWSGWWRSAARRAERAAAARVGGRRTRVGSTCPACSPWPAALTLLVSGLTQARSGLTAARAVLLVAAVRRCWSRSSSSSDGSPSPCSTSGCSRSPGFLGATVGALVVGLGIIAMTSNVPLLVQVGLGGTLWLATWLVFGWSATSVLDLAARAAGADPALGPDT